MNIVKQWIDENFDTQHFEIEEVDFKNPTLKLTDENGQSIIVRQEDGNHIRVVGSGLNERHFMTPKRGE